MQKGHEIQSSPSSSAATRGGLRSAQWFRLPTKSKKEEMGFGLYSYLLFAAKRGSEEEEEEEEEEKARYLKALKAWLREDHLKYHQRPSEITMSGRRLTAARILTTFKANGA